MKIIINYFERPVVWSRVGFQGWGKLKCEEKLFVGWFCLNATDQLTDAPFNPSEGVIRAAI